jgi:hypothetical protein
VNFFDWLDDLAAAVKAGGDLAAMAMNDDVDRDKTPVDQFVERLAQIGKPDRIQQP